MHPVFSLWYKPYKYTSLPDPNKTTRDNKVQKEKRTLPLFAYPHNHDSSNQRSIVNIIITIE